MAEIEDMFTTVMKFRVDTVREKCRSNDDLIMLASQLIFQAARIYEEIGGKSHAAAQFYSIADKIAGEPQP